MIRKKQLGRGPALKLSRFGFGLTGATLAFAVPMISWRVPSNFSLAFFEAFRTSALISDCVRKWDQQRLVCLCVCVPARPVVSRKPLDSRPITSCWDCLFPEASMVYLGPELGCPAPDGVHTVFASLEALGQAVPGQS